MHNTKFGHVNIVLKYLVLSNITVSYNNIGCNNLIIKLTS